MKVVIPLAGFGARLRPHTYTKPKPLLNVAGKPVLGHILDQLKGIELDEVIFIVGYLGDQIREYVEANYHFPARFFEQKRAARPGACHLAGAEAIAGPILIIFGGHHLRSQSARNPAGGRRWHPLRQRSGRPTALRRGGDRRGRSRH